MKAQVSRILVIKSPLELYKILRNKEELHSNENIRSFMEITDGYLNGCQCITDIKFSLMNDGYNFISNDENLVNLLKDNIQCSDIIFENCLI